VALRPYDVFVNRVWTGLVIALTAVVLGGVVYVVGHNPRVPQAGQTPGYSPPTQTSTPPATPSTSPSAPTSPVADNSSPGTPVSTGSTNATLIAFLGDDYTHGLGGSGGSATFPAQVAATLHVQERSFYVDNGGYAKSGASGQAYADLVSAVVAAHPNVVVVTGGRNDQADDPSTLTSRATALFSALRQGLPDAVIVAVAPWWGDSAQPAVLQGVATSIQQAVTAVNGTYLNLPDPLYGHPSWMADAADPNDQGYQAIAESLEPKLQPLLPS
jgi:lysophospholipase L1-like esterase